MIDWATLLGTLGTLLVLAAAVVLGGDARGFVDLASVLLVFIGSPLIVMMRFPLRGFFEAFVALKRVLLPARVDNADLIGTITQLADQARKGGLLALENARVEDAFMARGVALMVDGHEPEALRTVLMKEISSALQRRQNEAAVFRSLADVSPAMGMIGTLIGLVQMLGNMADPKAIGPAMAVALLTTLYGALIAQVFAGPVADKLLLLAERERRQRQLVMDGLASIQLGQNPRLIADLLQAYDAR